MPEAQRRFSMSRLEAFSDGVIAVIITIMVPEFGRSLAFMDRN